MDKEKRKIEVNRDTELFLEVCARRCNFKTAAEYLDAIMADIDLCGIIEECLKHPGEDLELFKVARTNFNS